MMTTSQQLLADYLAHGSEAAFRELVMRYTNLVYSTALRLVENDTHRAEDVAQTVFVDLARLARKLSGETMLGGWLYRHTCFVAARAMRGERRRQARERKAIQMNAHDDHSEANFAQVAPVLDEAIMKLAPEDQSAIVLRFFEQLDFSALGEALGSTEPAARKRVSRALDKLHDLLTARGMTLSASALGAALSARAVEAAPVEVVASLANAALASAAAGHGTALTFLKGTTASKIGLSMASVVGIAGATWLAWSLWGSWWPTKPAPLASNGTWTRLDKAQPLGHVIWPWAVTTDRQGALYVADGALGGRIQKRDLRGNWSLVASASQSPGGLKSAVRAMTIDPSGNLYVAEFGRFCKRDNQGAWTTLATEGKELGQVYGLRGFALDQAGNLYVADGVAEEVRVQLRKPDGQWTRVAGYGDEVGQVMRPLALAVDGQGNLYVSDYEAKRLQKRDATGRWSLVDEDPVPAGGPGAPPEPGVRFSNLTSDANGALYVMTMSREEEMSGQLLRRDTEGHWDHLAKRGSGPGQVFDVYGMNVDSAGALYVAELGNHRVQKRAPDGTWTVVCQALNEPGAFVTPASLALDSRGNIYVVDTFRRQVQKRDAQGRWTVLVDVPKELIELQDRIDAGWPLPFVLPVVNLFRHPWAVTVDREDNLYVADSGFGRVLKLNAAGQWELRVPPGNGLGKTMNPSYVWVDASSSLYVIDGGRRIQKQDREGRWSAWAQTAGPDEVFGVCAGPGGVGYVSSFIEGQLGIQTPDSHGGWTMVAPMGKELGQVGWPLGIASDAIGRLYVADIRNQRIQVRDVDGKWSMLAAGAEVGLVSPFGPASIAVDGQGVVYVAALPGVFRWTPQSKPKAATDTPGNQK